MSVHHGLRGNHNMSLGNFFLASTDSTPVMLAKVSPAIGLATLSQSENAVSFLDHFAALPWGAISGCVATIYSLCLLSEWVYKKVCAFIAWRRAR
jgi:hypothetical protein